LLSSCGPVFPVPAPPQKNAPSTSSVKDIHAELFMSQWAKTLNEQSKMRFYRQVKCMFDEEPYLGLKNRNYRSHIAKIRSSSHDLLIERGRYAYGTSQQPAKPSSKVFVTSIYYTDE
jgi:hypothetical protein